MSPETDPVSHSSQIDSLVSEGGERELTDIQLAGMLFSRRIEDSRKHLVVIVAFADTPAYLVYTTSQSTRSMDVTNEEDAYFKAIFYEDLTKEHPDDLEEHLLNIDSREEFVAMVKPAIVTAQGPYDNGKHNTQYLFGVLDQLMYV